MPPSPALRYSPGREFRADNHKRGRSLEGGLLFKEKDDDLALFNEMQSKERDNFLLQSSDDLEATFSSKLRHFSDFKLGITIPVRGESSELLNGDGEKNDYDWLLTPPDTPLFPSLEDEPPLASVPSRGRPRSQPITISRSSTMEKSYRSSRGSASPNRLSSSPRSVNSMSQSRGRPSSAHRSSPTPSQRSATPTRRPSPPPSKPSTPAPRSSTPTPRSSTPTPRRTSVSGPRGTSPIRTGRGNSVSPKIRAWQSNIPGFSSEVPPNLRTSLADRPASYVRGSSPASRNGRDSSLKFGRQSMSPTASRSVSSSHSQDRDPISSHSKGSVASSGDDDADSLQSVHVGSLDRLAPKRIGAFPNNRAAAFSKKSTRILSPSSAPKRSFDSALRQMDHRKSPQNMFRPLLSSVPTSSTFYAGKGSSVSRSLISRNSSVTTSSNTSCNQGTSAAIDTEGSDHQHEDMATENANLIDPDIQEDIFPFDKVDMLNKNVGHDIDDGSLHSRLSDIYRVPAMECEPGGSEEFRHHDVGAEISSTSDRLCVRADNSEVDSLEHMKVCSKCGCKYHVVETVEMDIDLCPDCYKEEKLLVAVGTKKTATGAAESSSEPSTFIPDEHRPSDEPESLIVVSEVQSNVIENDVDEKVSLNEDNGCPHHGENHTYHEDGSFSGPVMEGDEQRIVSLQGSGQTALDYCPPDNEIGSEQLMPSTNHLSLTVDVSEGAGISVLLTRSSSSKGPVVQGRTFVASTITYNNLSYARDSALRSSIGHGSTSTSSSHDFTSARQVETCVQRQLSGKKSDVDNYRYDARPQSSGSSLSGIPNHTHQALGLATNLHEENAEVSFDDLSEWHESSGTGDACTSDLSCNTAGYQLEENSKTSFTGENHLHEDGENFSNNARSFLEAEASANPSELSVEADNKILNTCSDGQNVTEVPTHRCLASISEIEAENSCQSTPESENGDMTTIKEFQDPSLATPSDKNNSTYVMERNNSDHADGVLESTVMIECREGSKARSLTLEEATNTILFCSSIVHDLAYQAATIAIEKENSAPLEDCRPTISVVNKQAAGRRDQPRGKTANKRNSKSHKVRQRRVETDVEPLSTRSENDENANEPMMRNVGIPDKMDSAKPMKLESKCNCTIM